jgi:hypothetical protein
MVQRKHRQGAGRNSGPVRDSHSGLWTAGIWLLVIINLGLIGSAAYRLIFENKTPVADTHKTTVQPKPTPVSPQPERSIRVELLNGCGVSGLAMSFANYLRSKNFDVVETKNYTSFNVKKTFVMDRVSLTMENARKVAKALGVSSKYLQPKLNPDLQVEVTVVLGHDFTHLNGYK